MIRRLWGLLIIIALVSVITGCVSSQSANQSKENASNEKTKEESAGQAEYKIQLGYVTTDTEDDPYYISASLFKKYAEELTNGKVEIELFPNGQLGGEREVLEGMQLGTIDGGVITNAYISGFASEALVFDLPFLFESYEQAHQTADGPVGDKILEALKEQGIMGLGWTEGGFRVMINNVRPVVNPEDADGIKFRSLENPMYLDMFKSIGANPTPMAWGEVFTAVQQGTVDGLEAPVSVLYQSKYQEISKYLSLTNHTYSPLLISVSSMVWDELPSDIQENLREAAAKTTVEQRQKNQENLEKILGYFKEAGVEVNEINNVADFQNKVSNVYESFRDEIGEDIMEEVGL